jgi:hypothetical protein
MVTAVWCTTEFVGWHCWPNAPERRKYLSLAHRHVFKVRVEAWVESSDREVEFHDLKDRVDSYILQNVAVKMAWTKDVPAYSCEHLAQAIGKQLISEKLKIKCVTVSEDGECGATTWF